jgi:hypothetical protein
MDLPKTSTHPTLDFLQNYSVINPLKQELPTVVFESESQCELELRFKICNSGNKNISNFQVTPIILEESEEKICGDWRVIPTENFYTLKIVVNKPKKDFVRCFFRVSFSCSSNGKDSHPLLLTPSHFSKISIKSSELWINFQYVFHLRYAVVY